jgi:hypothetical protein
VAAGNYLGHALSARARCATVGRRKLAAASAPWVAANIAGREGTISKAPAVVIAERVPRTHGYQVVFQPRGHVVLHCVDEGASTKVSAWPAI